MKIRPYTYDRNAFVLTCVISSAIVSAFMIVVQRHDHVPDDDANVVMLFVMGCLMVASFVGLWSWLGRFSEGVDHPPEPTLSRRKLRSYAEITRNVVAPVIFLLGFLLILVIVSRPSAG